MKWESHRWSTVLVAVLAVLDVVVLGVAYRAHNGALPPWQVKEPAYRMAPVDAATTTTTGLDEGSVTGPLLLSVNPAGLVLRAVRGACEERFHKTAQVAVGRAEDGTMKDVEVPGLREALGIMVFADGRLRVTGLDDEDCGAVTLDSVDEGKTWQHASGGAGIWRLDPDVTALDVIDPTGDAVDTQCVPQQIVNLPRQQAIGSCRSGGFFELADGRLTRTLPLSDPAQLSATAGPTPGSFYAFGATSECDAQVIQVSEDGKSQDDLECVGEDRAPLAIASAGKWLVVQAGNYLRSSTDGGQHFTDEPEASSQGT